ncbi:CTP synthase C-terminal region-related (seleno)protein [Bradyrhizobium sp.]
MAQAISVGVVGEFMPSFPPHARTNEAIDQMQSVLGLAISAEWISTSALETAAGSTLQGFDALWIAPGSPYKSLTGALDAIRFARTHDVPLLATCGGCQHVVIEYARNVLGLEDAADAEYDPYASNLLITPLSCSLVGQTMAVEIEPGSRVEAIYGSTSAFEQYYCNFGLNPDYQQRLHDAGLRIVGRDANGEARILTLPKHRFFIATLFVPQLTSSPDHPHPMIRAFFETAAGFAR